MNCEGLARMYHRSSVQPSGGYRHTLSAMRQQVDVGRRTPMIVARARELTRHLKDRDGGAEVHAIHNYVRDNVRYTRDPWGVETLTNPADMLAEVDQVGRASEDCDSHVVLEASLLEAIGHPTRFATAAMDATRPGEPSHVYLEVRSGGDWVPLDPIAKGQVAGWVPPPLAGKYGADMGDDTVIEEIEEELDSAGRAFKWMIGLGMAWAAWRYVIKPLSGR